MDGVSEFGGSVLDGVELELGDLGAWSVSFELHLRDNSWIASSPDKRDAAYSHGSLT